MNYIQPDYESLKPRKLRETIRTMHSDQMSGISSRSNISPQMLSTMSTDKILANPRLVKFCAYYLNHEKLSERRMDFLNIILSYLNKRPRNFTQIYKQLFYRFLEDTDDRTLRKFLKKNQKLVTRKFKIYLSDAGSIFFDDRYPTIISNKMLLKVQESLYQESHYELFEDNYLFEEHRLISSFKSYQNIMKVYLIAIVGYKIFFDSFNHYNDLVNEIAEDSLVKSIYERIIDKIPDEMYKVERYKLWIDFIHEKLGSPYSETRFKWIGISESIQQKFNSWIIRDKILYFFDKKDPSRRAPFWKRYAHEIMHIEYIEDASKAVLMFTRKNHLMVEFLQTGNAFYIYQMKNIEQFYSELKNVKSVYLTRWEKIEYLKGSNKLEKIYKVRYHYRKGGWYHLSGWEYKFNENLRTLGLNPR